MMGGYYPEGVTGREYQIAGPQAEWSEVRAVSCGNEECRLFDTEQEVMVDLEAYDWREWGVWTCEACGREQDYEADIYICEDDRIGEY